MTLFGIPYPVWGAICLLMTGVWFFIWPENRIDASQPMRSIILRWFHPLSWLLLSAAAFITGVEAWGGAAAAIPVTVAAFVIFTAFLVTWVSSKNHIRSS